MFGAAAVGKSSVGEPPRQPPQHQPRSTVPAALSALHQHVPRAMLCSGAAVEPAVAWKATRHEEVRHEAAHEQQETTQTKQGTRTPKESTQKAERMGCGALNNAVGAWTAAGIFVSKSRAGRVDETVNIGAQANPSGVYPVIQPIAYFHSQQQAPGAPSFASRGSSDLQEQQNAGGGNPTRNAMPVHAHPHPFGPGLQHYGGVYSRPLSAPASTSSDNLVTSSPVEGAASKRVHPSKPGCVGVRRTSSTTTRVKGGSAGTGMSKAALRAAARAAAAASVISAVADSRKTEARQAATAAAATAAAAAGPKELERE